MRISLIVGKDEHIPQVGEFYPMPDGIGGTKYHRVLSSGYFEEDPTGIGPDNIAGTIEISDEGFYADPDAPYPTIDPWDEMGYQRE